MNSFTKNVPTMYDLGENIFFFLKIYVFQFFTSEIKYLKKIIGNLCELCKTPFVF